MVSPTLSRLAPVAACALALGSCAPAPWQPPVPPDPVAAAARSLHIVRSATKAHPRVLKILFYGQSISTRQWTDRAVATLRATYPDVTFEVRNLALGGWSAALLERAAKRDVEDFYPDLIVFHVYGDHRAYERIIRTFRAYTAADIIVQTDHVVVPVEPLCDEGLHLRWSPPPGCRGRIWFRQNSWEEFMAGLWAPTMARRYDLSLEPRRRRWDRYLRIHGLAPDALLADGLHPNERGWRLMADLFTSWFGAMVERAGTAPAPGPGAVRSLAPPAPGETRRYAIEGNRFELIAAGPLDGKVTVAVDGRPPRRLDGCWQDGRVSPLPNLPDWPALNRVSVQPGYHHPDRWTLRVERLDDAQAKFAFSLRSDRTGDEGRGEADKPFTARSGHVTIRPEDWNLPYARTVTGRGVAEGTTFSWERSFRCGDQPAIPLADGRTEQRHVLATGLANERHVVELTVAADAPAISELRAYRPALKP